MPSSQEHSFVTSGLVRLTRPQLVGTMAGLMLSLLLAALDQTIVGTAEPRIIAQLSGFDRYPWVATAYLLTSTLAVPIFGKLSDIYGRKWFFLAGCALFTLASALCGASGTMTFLPLDGMNQLIAFRGLQGIAAGVMTGLTFTILGDIFSPVERGKYMGFFAAVWGSSSIFGPTLGGWLTDHYSWRSVFYVNLPVGLIAIAAIYMEFPDIRPQGPRKQVDWAGVFSLIGCIVPLLLALTWASIDGWSSAKVESLLAIAATMLATFLYVESRAAEPLLPLSLFTNPVIAVCSLAVFVLGAGMFGVIIYLPLFMQGVLGVSATQSGNLLTPLMLGAVVGSITTGQLNSRLKQYKPQAVAGSIAIAIGMILFARMDGTTQPAYVVMSMVISGLGMGLLQPVYTVAVQNVAPLQYMGAATSSTMFFRSIGSTVGVAIFGTVLLSRFHAEFARVVPTGTSPDLLKPFNNPMMLAQMRPQLDAMFAPVANGAALLQTLFTGVRSGLLHGLQVIFFSSAIIMCLAVVLHLGLKNVPLRGHQQPAEPPAH